MALLRCDFFSDALRLNTSMAVVLPQETSAQIGVSGGSGRDEPPVLYLLHGLSDNDTAWLRYTSIERYAEPLGLAVVMPQVHRSFYADEVHGNRYWTFLSEELPRIVGAFFRVSRRSQDTFVAGLSMGGYGAMRWALREPGRFAAAASLSGALDIDRLRVREHAPGDDPHLLDRVFGDRPVTGTEDDLPLLLDRAVAGGRLPRLYACCGTGDELHQDSARFVDACLARGVPITAEFEPGDHEWRYWDRKIQDVLAWLRAS